MSNSNAEQGAENAWRECRGVLRVPGREVADISDRDSCEARPSPPERMCRRLCRVDVEV